MTGVTYADLLARADIHIALGGSPRWTERVDSQESARAAIAARVDLLEALGAHIWALVAPARRTGHSHGNDPTERAAVALAKELHTLLATDSSKTPRPRRSAHPWARAAMEVRAASDLLAVHHDNLARPRSPDADAWAVSVDRAAALVPLGPMTERVLIAEDALALRAVQAHLPWAEIRRLLPDTATARDLARALQDRGTSAPTHLFGALRLIGETPRSDTPTHELTDRIARIRHLTWDLLTHPDHSTATLRDLATLATAVHAHTAAHHTTPGAPAPRAAELLLARARAWQHTAHDLAEYLTPTPAHPEIHEHVRAATRLLARVAPLTPAADERDPGAERGEITPTLRSALAATDKVQDWASQVFGRLADHTHLYVPASTLTGDVVTDDPSLVHAKLTGGLVPAPKARTDHTIERYRTALPPGSALAPRRPRSAIEPALEPMIIGRGGGGAGP